MRSGKLIHSTVRKFRNAFISANEMSSIWPVSIFVKALGDFLVVHVVNPWRWRAALSFGKAVFSLRMTAVLSDSLTVREAKVVMIELPRASAGSSIFRGNLLDAMHEIAHGLAI